MVFVLNGVVAAMMIHAFAIISSGQARRNLEIVWSALAAISIRFFGEMFVAARFRNA